VKYCDACRSSYPADFATCPKDQSSLRAITDLPPGLVLRGKYEILEPLGAGGMGAVYKARHLAFGELRAIKFLGTHLSADSAYQGRFRSEAVLARRLQHPNVVRIDDLDTTEDGRPFIVMEHVEGRSLRSVLRAGGAVAHTRAVRIAMQVCAALSAAHGVGILHRDIKPDNLLLLPAEGGEVVKVLDFGLAKMIEGFDSGVEQVATRTGMIVGTPQYVSPEQALPGKGVEIDGRADLYALGVVLYEMLTGSLPFGSDTPMGMLMEHIQTRPQPPELASPGRGIPPAVSAIVMKALEKRPADRFASAEEMRQALANAAAGLPTSAAPAAAAPVTPPAGAAATVRPAPTRVPTPATVVVPPAAGATPALASTRPVPARPPSGVRAQRPAAGRMVIATPPLEAGSARSTWAWPAVALLVGLGWLGWTRSASPPTASPAPAPAADVAPPQSTPAAAAAPSDPALLAEVRQILFDSPALREARIEVAVTNGIVTLTGAAATATERDLAQSLAGSVSGVRRVFSTVRLEPPPASALAAAAPSPEPAAAAPPPPPALHPRPGGPSPQVHALLDSARREIEAGNHERAAKIFEEVLRIEPGNPVATDALERWRTRRPPPR
jgi:serine/threonine-protein kinase